MQFKTYFTSNPNPNAAWRSFTSVAGLYNYSAE